MKKILSLVLVIIIGIFALFGCKEEPSNVEVVDVDIKIAALNGYNAMCMAGLIKSEEYGEIALVESAEEIKRLFVNDEADVVAVPLNLAGKLCNELDKNVRMLAVTNLGVLCVVDSTGEIKSLSDLADKTVYASAKGLTSQYIFEYVLGRRDMLSKVTVEYKDSYDELKTAVKDGSAPIALMPYLEAVELIQEAGEGTNIAIDIAQEWMSITNSMQAMGCVIAKAEFVENNEAAIKSFINKLGDSVNFVCDEQEAAAQVLADAGIASSKEAALNSIDACNVICMVESEMREIARNTVEILYGVDAESMGGSLPSSTMYLVYD